MSDSDCESDSDPLRGILCGSKFSCMCVFICFLKLVLGSILSDCGRLLYIVEYLKNMDDFNCLVLGLYDGFNGGLLHCGLCGVLYIVYSDCGVLVDCILCM